MSRLVELAYQAGWQLVGVMPEPVAAALFRLGADRAYRRQGRGTRRLAANLRRIVGPDMSPADFEDLHRRALRSYARYWMETFRLHRLTREDHLRRFRLDREPELAAAVTAGRGVVLALPHSGNWEQAGAWATARGWPLITVAERLKPEGVYQRFLRFRRALGMEIIPTSGAERAPLELLADKLRDGYVVPLLADRDLSVRGIEVRFFGGRARLPAGPALLALRTGAPLYALHMWFEDGVSRAALDGPITVPDPDSAPLDERVRLVTQEIADRLATGIARHPVDWHMLQRVWLDEPAVSQDEAGSAAAPSGRT